MKAKHLFTLIAAVAVAACGSDAMLPTEAALPGISPSQSSVASGHEAPDREVPGTDALPILSMAAPGKGKPGTVTDTPPARLWICHGPGHQTTNTNEGVEETDWIIEQPSPGDEPRADQFTFCADHGGELIQVSERGACRGHRADDPFGETSDC